MTDNVYTLTNDQIRKAYLLNFGRIKNVCTDFQGWGGIYTTVCFEQINITYIWDKDSWHELNAFSELKDIENDVWQGPEKFGGGEDMRYTKQGLWKNREETKEGKYLVQRRDGTVPVWPNFVLGARDPAAAVALRAYALEANRLGYGAEFVNDVFKLVSEFDAYIVAHGKGNPSAGPEIVDDPETIRKMSFGKGS